METSTMVVLIRRFLTKQLDIRNLLSLSRNAFKQFKGIIGYVFYARGRFARRGRALDMKVVFGKNLARIYDFSGDYAEYNFPLLFGVGNLQTIFFYSKRFFLRAYFRHFRFSRRQLNQKKKQIFKYFKKPNWLFTHRNFGLKKLFFKRKWRFSRPRNSKKILKKHKKKFHIKVEKKFSKRKNTKNFK